MPTISSASIAQQQGRFAEAEASYRQALDIYLEFGDRHSAARTYHQLGIVAQEQERFAEAEASYRQALDIYLEFGDRHSAASTYHQLGNVAQDAGAASPRPRPATGRPWTSAWSSGTGTPRPAPTISSASIALQQRRFAEAEASYRQALDIYLEFGDRHSAASTYHQLGNVARAQKRFAEAEASYRQALDIYLDTDQEKASTEATTLGLLFSEVGRHTDAATMLLDGALLWHQLTGKWDTKDLQYLKREHQLMDETDFSQIIAVKVPSDLQEALAAAIDNVGDL